MKTRHALVMIGVFGLLGLAPLTAQFPPGAVQGEGGAIYHGPREFPETKWVAEPPPAEGSEFHPSLSDAEKKIESALDKLCDVDYISTPFLEVLTSLSDAHGMQMVWDSKELNEAGIALDEPIDLKLEKVTIRHVLKEILEPRGLGYVNESVLRIRTAEEARKRMAARVYPVGDLATTTRHVGDLINMIETSVGGVPEMPWLSQDGEGGTIEFFEPARSLVIKQNQEGHREVLRLLRALRSAMKR